jgi:SAM-dependent methyltransferase
MTRLESDYYDWMGHDPERARGGLRHYLPWFPRGPVLELACGRGEFLGLLREAGVDGEGIDVDEGMVAAARAAGHDVQQADALSGLAGRPDASVQGVFCAHFVEHLAPDELTAVLADAARVLAPGGHLVAATPNAACLSVLGHDFWRDPTHVRPYDPQLLAFLCAAAGLEVVETGANPRNHGGPPPHVLPPAAHVDPDLRADVVAAVQSAAQDGRGRPHPDSPWHVFGHLLGVLEERLRATQQELVDLRRSYASLVDELYPPNEVYVVARAV